MTFMIALPEVGLKHTTVANQRAKGNSTSKLRGSLTDNSCEMSTDNLSTIGNLLMLASVEGTMNILPIFQRIASNCALKHLALSPSNTCSPSAVDIPGWKKLVRWNCRTEPCIERSTPITVHKYHDKLQSQIFLGSMLVQKLHNNTISLCTIEKLQFKLQKPRKLPHLVSHLGPGWKKLVRF